MKILAGVGHKISYSNAFENTLVRIEQDEKLNALQEQRAKIKACVDTFDREHKEVFNQRYRNRMGWEMIAQLHYVDERTHGVGVMP